jgi:glycosyltransferase 2 family protein
MRSSSAGSGKISFRFVYWAVALLVAAVFLFFSLRGIHWADVWRTLSHANLGLVALSMLVATCSLFLRAIRWRILLRAGAPVTIPTAFWATAAGYFGNNFLPARAGEVVRSLMVSASSGLSKTFVLTTALSERMCDGISLVLISSVVLLTLPVKPGWFAHAATPFAILGICGAIGIAVLPKLQAFCQKCVNWLPLSAALKIKSFGIIGQILVGMRSFHDPKRLSIFASFTAVIWFSDAVSTVLGMRALNLPGTLPVAFLLTTGLGLGSALPSTPGYVGIYQFVAVSVLTPFGFSKTGAIAYILLSQAVQYVMITFWGVLGMLRSRTVWPRHITPGPNNISMSLSGEI